MPLFQRLFSSDGFMPHGHCFLWNPGLIWLHVTSDALIALAYYSIPITLVYFVRRRQDLAFSSIFLCFAVFIISCGTTHLLEIWNIWHPTYWLTGVVKAFTALVSLGTAILLVRLVPQALQLPSPGQLRGVNEALRREIADRTAAVEETEILNEELRQQAERLAATNRELEAFTYTVSHDLRAPLRHIRGFAEILEEENGPALTLQGRAHLAKISKAALRLDALIDDLLNLSRVSRTEIRLTRVPTGRLVREVIQELQHDTQNRKITWRIEPLPDVEADPGLLKQVWANLLSNAVKYTGQRPEARIEISARDSGDLHEFRVRDNGAGFDMQYAGKLFGIFERLHREEFEGTGVGLANVRRIVDRHGGTTWAQGEVGIGATFYFTLPKRADSAPRP